MPAQDGLRLNDLGERASRLGISRVIHTRKARSLLPQVKPMRCTPERNIELMPQEEVLDFKLLPRPEQQVDYEHRDEMKECKHRNS